MHHINWFDKALICLFMIGIYTGFTIQISEKLPFPSTLAGVAGVVLLWRRRNQITSAAFAGLIIVVALYLASVLSATDIRFLPRRMNGLIQLIYSIVIGYALFLTVIQASRHQIAGLFLVLSVVILVGCLLEQYAGLRPVSDAVRKVIYSWRIYYDADLRDLMFYNRVRPKFFASEPSLVNVCFTLFTFVWMVVSPWRWKLVVYVALVGVGFFAMPGPTLLLALLLILPYMLFLASRKAGRLDLGRLLIVACVAAILAGPFIVLAQIMFPVRLAEITSGNDGSFFVRVHGPVLAAFDIFAHYPFAGAGLTGEPFIENEVRNVYQRSAAYSASWGMEFGHHTNANQLFLVALGLPRLGLGLGHNDGHDGLAARARCAQRRLLLNGLGHLGPRRGRLCRTVMLVSALSCRRGRDLAPTS